MSHDYDSEQDSMPTLADFTNAINSIEFINRTVYESEDIRALMVKIEETINYVHKNNPGLANACLYTWRNTSNPSRLQKLEIGYYQPASYEEQGYIAPNYIRYNNYCAVIRERTLCPRLGVAHPKHVLEDSSPLECLARAAEEQIAHSEVVASIFRACLYIRGTRILSKTNIVGSTTWLNSNDRAVGHFQWLRDFRIRVKDKVNAKAAAQAKYAKLCGAQARAELALETINAQIARAERMLNEMRAKQLEAQVEVSDITQKVKKSKLALTAGPKTKKSTLPKG